MNIIILWSIFPTVGLMLLTVQCVAGSNSISSFSVKSWNSKSSSWDEDANILPGEDARLECTIGEDSQLNELQIERADGVPLSIYNARDIQRDAQSQSLVVILRLIECSQMGTYVCKSGRGENKTVDFGIHDCPPQPCKDQSTDITLYAGINKTEQFSVCVEAFPNVDSLALNGEEVGFDRTNENLPGVNCTMSKLGNFSTYQISCKIKFGDEIDYGVYDFSISSGAARNQKVSFALQIEKPGRPECPTGIISTSHDSDSVTLLWQPVNNRGGSQPVNYTIFYTTNETEWQRYNTVEDAQTTITALEAEVLYGFRVASANEYSQVIDENTCNETVEVKIVITTAAPTPTSTTAIPSADADTARKSTKDKNSANISDQSTILYIIIAILSVLVIIIVIIAIVRCRLDRIFERLRSHSWNARSTRSHRNGRHVQETTQQTSLRLFNFRHKSNLPYHNINAGESL